MKIITLEIIQYFRRQIITAAHCVTQTLDGTSFRGWTRGWKAVEQNWLTVRLGEYDFETDSETRHEDRKVIGMEIHPSYEKNSAPPFFIKNDIAIITLDR